MPLSAEAQGEEKQIAKQAAIDDKVREPSLVLALNLFCIIGP